MYHYLKQTFQHSAIYSCVNILQKGVGFLMIPVYTHFLSRTEYGVLEILDLTVMIISMMTGMQLGGAIIRFYHRYETREERRSVLASGLFGVTVFVLAVVVLLELSAGPVSTFLLGSSAYTRFLQIIFLAVALQTVATVPESLLLAQKRSAAFATITFLTFLSYLSFNILFVVGYEMGVMGMVLSTLITKCLNVSMLFAVTRREFSLRFSTEKFSEMLRYSLPLLPASLCMFVIHYSDRYFIREFISLEDLGTYSLGYKFGMIISILVAQPVFRIWNTQRFEIAKEPDAGWVFGRMFTYIMAAFLAVGLIIGTLIDEAVSLMAPPEYQGASVIALLVVFGYILFGCASFSQLGIFISYKTKYLFYIQFSVAILNVGLNLLLIPTFGIKGAAFSTVLTFFSLGLFSYLVSQRLVPVKYEYKRLATLLLLFAGIIFVSRFIDLPLLASLAAKLGLLALYPGLLYVGGFFNHSEKAKAKEILQKMVIRFSWSGARG